MPPKTSDEKWVEEFIKLFDDGHTTPTFGQVDWLRTLITTLRKESDEAYQQGKEDAYGAIGNRFDATR